MKKTISILTAMIMILTVNSKIQAGIFTDDFSGGINSAYWTIEYTTPPIYTYIDTQGDIRLKKVAAAAGGYNSVRVLLNISAITNGGAVQLAGDFDASVDFYDGIIAGGGLNQIEMHTGFADGRIFYDVRDGSNVHVWTGSYLSGFSTTVTSGTFRIKRAGSTLTAYLNGSLVYSLNHTAANLTYLAFALQNNNGSNDYTQVTFDNFRIEGDNVFSPPVCPSADLTDDCFVDNKDFAWFASWWLVGDCNTKNWCGGADFDMSGDVGLEDLKELAAQWLSGEQ